MNEGDVLLICLLCVIYRTVKIKYLLGYRKCLRSDNLKIERDVLVERWVGKS